MTDSKKVFFDTAPFIYYLENEDDYKDKVKRVIADHAEDDYITSTITVSEYLTGAFKNGDEKRVLEFNEMISEYEFEITSIDWDIAVEAARIRANYVGFKMMDSLQLAAAKLTGCDLFVTNDLQLKQFGDVEVTIIDEV